MVSYIIKQRYHVLSCKRADFHLENRIKINNDTTDGLTKMFGYSTYSSINWEDEGFRKGSLDYKLFFSKLLLAESFNFDLH